MWRKWNPSALLVGMQTGAATVENSMEIPQKMELPFDPAIPLLGIQPKRSETLIQKNICTPMFIAALFTTAKIWKQPKCPSVDEWLKKLWYIYIMDYYSTIKKKQKKKKTKTNPRNTTFCDSIDGPGITILSEMSQSEKDISHVESNEKINR